MGGASGVVGMLIRQAQIRKQLNQLLDACLAATAFAVAYLIRSDEWVIEFFRLRGLSPFSHYMILMFVVIPATPIILEANGFYDRSYLVGARRKKLWALLKGCLVTTLALVLVLYLFKLSLGRTILILFGVLVFVFILVKEELLGLINRTRFTRERTRQKVILVGLSESVQRVADRLSGELHDVAEVVGVVDPSVEAPERVVELLHKEGVNDVIISGRDLSMDTVENVVRACETEGVDVWLAVDFLDTRISKPGFARVGGVPLLVFRSVPEMSWQWVVKQVMDVVLSAVALVLLLPVFVVIAVLIKLDSKGPVFFKQLRCGLNGRPFVLYKFRTMVVDAEARKRELEKYNEMSGPVFKLSNDPRVTRVGRILRKFSLDELPQFFNVLKGDMSLVGPRPLPVEEVNRFDQLWHRRRMSVKPGLTCLWQISGRNEIRDFQEWVRLDLEYIDNWSLWLDLKILLKTVPAVIRGVGAK